MRSAGKTEAGRGWRRGAARLLRRASPWRAAAEAERRADRAEALLTAVLEAIPEGVVLLDGQGRYRQWNATYAKIYHRSADLFAVGERLIDVLRVGVARGDYPDAVGREEAWLRDREAQILQAQARYEQRVSDGRWLMIEDRRLPDGGLLGLRVDITEMKEQAFALAAAAEAAEAANRAKSEFLANISHEIRTPLHGILGMAQVLARDEGLNEAQQTRVGLIRRSGVALLELLNDLLDLAKIEAGKLSLQEVEFRPAAVAEAACAPFEALAQDKGLTLELDFDALQGVVWLGDPLRLQQVLANLVSNAIKFTARGRVRAEAGLDGPGVAVFHVRDTGIGIPSERLAEMFEKFAQAESAKDRRFGGTGLGLALSRQLAELMGGELSATSAPGQGSTFTLRMPVRAADGGSGEARDLEDAPEALAARVLAAEDNAINQMILRALLEPLGVELVMANDGAEAIEAFRGGGFDLVLMDIQMPGTDGLAATREIRRLEAAEGRGRVPIIALSANVMAHQTAEYEEAGMNDVVGKPYEAETLWRAIARQLQDEATPRAELAARRDGR
jgi:signal transduction histidine kinase/ActR/RegA family two-component response regulator